MTVDDVLKLKEQARSQIVEMFAEMKPLCYEGNRRFLSCTNERRK